MENNQQVEVCPPALKDEIYYLWLAFKGERYDLWKKKMMSLLTIINLDVVHII